MKKHWKLLLFISIEFIIVITIVLLTLFAGRKTYTVTFDLNGGTYISGSLEQTVRHGQSAIPPEVTKDGAYLLEWDDDYTKITKDKVITAVWEYETSFGIEFEFIGNSNYCLISGCYDNISGDVYIGANYNGLRVLGIKDGAFKNCDRITGIYLLDGLVSIGNDAFSGCTSLEVLEIPSTVEVIGSNILKGCEKLEKLSVPFIGSAFGSEDNDHFSYFFGTANETYNKKYVPESLKEVTISGRGEIPELAFLNCINLETIKLSNEITKISKFAFRNCTSLKEVEFSDSLEEIDEGAFLNCTSLNEIKFSDSLTKINTAAFANCTLLKEITIGKNTEWIDASAFQNCVNIEKFIVEKGNKQFKDKDGLLIILNDSTETIYTIIEEEYTDDFVDLSDYILEDDFRFPIFDGFIERPSIKDPIIFDPEFPDPSIKDDVLDDEPADFFDKLK